MGALFEGSSGARRRDDDARSTLPTDEPTESAPAPPAPPVPPGPPTGEAARAVAAERRRFGHDLHDLLGPSLAVIGVKAELAQRLLEADANDASDAEQVRAQVQDQLAQVERLARETMAAVRAAVETYVQLDLRQELERAVDALRAAGIRPVVEGDPDAVPAAGRELAARAMREGVTNVIRHSAASTCRLQLTSGHAEVRDDGSGRPGSRQPAGFGLAGLRRRVEEAGGTLRAGREADGYVLRVHLPSRAARA